MTAPRLLFTPGELPPLSCEGCTENPLVETAGHVALSLDSYVPPLPRFDLLIPPPYAGRHLFGVEWGPLADAPPVSSWPARLSLLQPVRTLSSAYISSEPLGFVDFVPSIAALADGIERIDLDFFNIPVNRGGGHCRFSEYSPRTERVHDCNVDITAGTRARGHGEIRPIRGTGESLITRVVIDFQPNLLNHSIVTLEIDGFSAVDSPGFDYGDRSFRGRHRESVVNSPLGDTGYENPLGSRDSLFTPFESTAEPPPNGHRGWMFRFSPVVGDAIDWLAQTFGERQLHLWAYLPTAGLVAPETYRDLGIPYNTFPRRFGDVIRLLAPLFNRHSREALRHAGPYYNPNTEYLDLSGRRQVIPDDPEALALINREREAYNRAHPREEALPPILMNRGPVLDWVFTDLLTDPARLAALIGAAPADLPAVTSRIRFNETDLELPFGTLTLAEGSEAQVHYGIQVARDEAGEVDPRATLRVTFDPLAMSDIDLEWQNYHVRAASLRAERVVVSTSDLQALFSDHVPPEAALQVELQGVHLEGLQLADRRSGLSGELGEADIGSLRFIYHSGAWRLQIGGPGEYFDENGRLQNIPEGVDALERLNREREEYNRSHPDSTPLEPVVRARSSGISLAGLAIETLLGRVSFDSASIPEVRVRSTVRPDEPGRGVTVEVPSVSSRTRMDFYYYPPHSTAPLRLSLEGGSSLSNLLYYYRPNGTIIHQARFDVEGMVREARIEHELIGAILLSTLRSPDAETSEPMTGRVQFRVLNPDLMPEDGPETPMVQPDIQLDLPFMAIGSDGAALRIPRETSTIEDGSLSIHADHYALEGILNIAEAQLRGLGDGRLELGDSVIAADQMEIALRAHGPARFEYSSAGWRLMRTPGATDPLSLGLTVNNLGFIHFNDPTFLPPGIPRDPVPEAFETRLHIANAEVEVSDLRAIHFERLPDGVGGSRGRLTRLESGSITAHHVEGGGAIWAPLAIWGMVRGLFPVLGRDAREAPPSRPDPAPIMSHLPADVLCGLGDGDFFRIGSVDFRYFPLTAETFAGRSARSLRRDPPRGDWEVRIEDLLLNLHEADIPGGPVSRHQFALMRIPEIHAGRVWADERRARFRDCPAAATDESAVCGEERPFWNLGLGEFLGAFYLNDPQRGGSFLFRRWIDAPSDRGLAALLGACPAP